MTPTEQYFAQWAIVAFAGPIAEARARRGSGPGWVRLLSEDRRRAVHEAGHAVAASLSELRVVNLSIIRDPSVVSTNGQYSSGGRCVWIRNQEQAPKAKRETTFVLDHSQGVRAAWVLTPLHAPAPRWKAVLAVARALRSHSANLIEQNWQSVLSLASDLERQKELRPDQLASNATICRLLAAASNT